MSSKTECFNIAGLTMRVIFGQEGEDISLLPSFINFRTHQNNVDPYITIFVGHCTNKEKGEFIDDVKTATGSIRIERLSNGYRCFIRNTLGNVLCVLDSDDKFTHCSCELYGTLLQKQTGLKTAALLAFSAASSYKNTIVIHSSSIVYHRKAYCFLGKSGTGKSTHSDLWVNNIKDSKILNDDSPILKINNNKIYVYGSPWSGKRNYYNNESAELGALVRIDRSKKNSIELMNTLESYTKIYPSCACFKCSKQVLDNFLEIFGRIIESSKSYTLHCLPNAAAAILCCDTVTK